MGVPYNHTPSFFKLKDQWNAILKKSGFRDIEVEDKLTGEPGPFLLGLNVGQILDMGGQGPNTVRLGGQMGPRINGYEYSATPEDSDTCASARVKAAVMRMEAQAEWLDYIRSMLPDIHKRHNHGGPGAGIPWQARVMEMYVEGLDTYEIADKLGKLPVGRLVPEYGRRRRLKATRTQVKSFLARELKWLRSEWNNRYGVTK